MTVLLERVDDAKITAAARFVWAPRADGEPPAPMVTDPEIRVHPRVRGGAPEESMRTDPEISCHVFVIDTGAIEARGYSADEVGLPVEIAALFDLQAAHYIQSFAVRPKTDGTGSYAAVLTERDALELLNARYRLADGPPFSGAVVADWPAWACSGGVPAHAFGGVSCA